MATARTSRDERTHAESDDHRRILRGLRGAHYGLVRRAPGVRGAWLHPHEPVRHPAVSRASSSCMRHAGGARPHRKRGGRVGAMAGAGRVMAGPGACGSSHASRSARAERGGCATAQFTNSFHGVWIPATSALSPWSSVERDATHETSPGRCRCREPSPARGAAPGPHERIEFPDTWVRKGLPPQPWAITTRGTIARREPRGACRAVRACGSRSSAH